jgi:hypothetical protein
MKKLQTLFLSKEGLYYASNCVRYVMTKQLCVHYIQSYVDISFIERIPILSSESNMNGMIHTREIK